MWDVNAFLNVEMFLTQNAFDLNYVGCELQDILRALEEEKEFDLNYVGCEPRLWCLPSLWFLPV